MKWHNIFYRYIKELNSCSKNDFRTVVKCGQVIVRHEGGFHLKEVVSPPMNLGLAPLLKQRD